MSATRKPTSVGDMLTEEFLAPMNIDRARLARELGATRPRRGADERHPGPEFWLHLQMRDQIWRARNH